MPRRQRISGRTGWAHIILRGINRENLFYDRKDFSHFQTKLEFYLKECEIEYAVICLMSNHVHLLLREESGSFQLAMKKITVSYAHYYNTKLDRVGPVFQDRYRSEPVNDERYLLTAARYIYQNPQKAGICRAADYPWTMLNLRGVLSVYFKDGNTLLSWLQETNNDSCMEYDSVQRFSDEEILSVLAHLTGSGNPQCLQDMDRESRTRILRQIKGMGVPIRSISRLTGLNRNIIQRT